ncbi:MAG: glycosyltransferase family 4 protein [Ruminococcaceae bacterium]|nr:glycosyltransferase family 4 protein [Oscillospiraceae bacterium]
MKKVAIIGHFAFGKTFLDGQTVKTKTLTEELERKFGEEQVLKQDTHGGKKKLLFLLFMLVQALVKCKNVIILPAHNGLRIIAPLLFFLNKLFGRKLHYAVIGGWLPGFLEKRKVLTKVLKGFHCIYVETKAMKKALEEKGFSNVLIMPNCKKLQILKEEELVFVETEPFKLCTFSRVMKEKGIEDAIEAVKKVNEAKGRTVFTLDIYGQVDGGQTEWFEELQKSFPEYVRYGGLVPFDQSVEVLKNYFALLFPTRFYTEGIPGTIIDAYAAGVPVISSKWENFDDIVEENVTGLGYEFLNVEALNEALLNVAENEDMMNQMKSACIQKAEAFLPENALQNLYAGM